MALPPMSPGRRVVLPEPSRDERAALRARNASRAVRNGRMTRSSLAVGFPRSVPAALRTQPLASLTWITLADGARAAKIDVVSPGAAAMRVALEMEGAAPGMTLRFTGNGERARHSWRDPGACRRFGACAGTGAGCEHCRRSGTHAGRTERA